MLINHKENDFHEFDRETLIPHMLSTEGPALAIADINKDGLAGRIYRRFQKGEARRIPPERSGKFTRIAEPDLDHGLHL